METNRLRLRQYTMEDIGFLGITVRQSRSLGYTGSGMPWTRGQPEERLDGFIKRYDNDEGTGVSDWARS